MPKEFLSITIPTRNRSQLLRDLLASLAAEIDSAQLTTEDVRIYVSDNASTDATPAVVEEVLGSHPHLTYTRNATNIGAMGNVLLCAAKGEGEFRWIIGDDETLPAGTLGYLLGHLRRHRPGWFVHSDGGSYARGLRLPRTFGNIRDFARAAAQDDPETLMTAGAISLNTFRADCFDHELAGSLAGRSTYAHFFGLMKGLHRTGAPVFFTERRTIIFREVRPAPSDHELPDDSDGNWSRCLSWVRDEFDLPDLDPEIHSRLVSRNLLTQLRRHPWATLRNHAPLFLIPGTYPRLVKRLWYALK